MTKSHTHKRGAALVIVLGFLAILTITIIAFTTQTRSERLAGRAYASSTQTRHLLSAALTRAMEDIDLTVNGALYPRFFAFGSQDPFGGFLADSINFTLEEDYFAFGNERINREYTSALNTAAWQSVVDSDGTAIGRVGYIVINSSGLLDANEVGGATSNGSLVERRAGISPAEIQLANEGTLIDELNASKSNVTYPHIDGNSPAGVQRSAPLPSLSPGLAFAYNRDHAWKRFETLRDVSQLNKVGSPNILTTAIKSFSTFSYDPADDSREFMGTNYATVVENEATIRAALEEINAVDTDFVLNQLRDYLDTDTVPEDAMGNYTDLSVEPVPLINEISLSCDFLFTPEIELDEEGEVVVLSVTVSNSYALELEIWYPFVGYTNTLPYTVNVNTTPESSEPLPPELFEDVANWLGDYEVPQAATIPGAKPHNFRIHAAGFETEVTSRIALVNLFNEMQVDIQFPSIVCTDSNGNIVDRVLDLELPMENAVADDLLPLIEVAASNLFSVTSAIQSNRFVVGMACVDPRLNANGASIDLWKEESAAGEGASAGTMGEINRQVIVDNSVTPDRLDLMYVRNRDRIDTPWEFTYFLYDIHQPWKTMQMLKHHDTDNTRSILTRLSPYPAGQPERGRVNPYSLHTNVIASVFMNMPLDEFHEPATKRLTANEAVEAAEQFMDYFSSASWPADPSAYGTEIFISVANDPNPWVQEGFFRNTYELFNPRDTLFTILLAAQSGSDADDNGRISDTEVRSAQQAVVYIWRDPVTEKAACVFYGLSDTLQNSAITGQSWSELLRSFEP